MSSALPRGWAAAIVDDLGEFINGVAFRPTDWGDEGFPIIRIQNLTDPDRKLNRTLRPVPDTYRIEQGDILVSWSATLDAFIWRGPVALLNQHIFRFVPNERLAIKKFSFHLLRYAIAEMAESEHAHGSTMRHINRGPFLAWKIYLPPSGEQHRIVAAIEEQISRVDAGVAALERVQKELVRYRASVLKAACDGRLVPTEAEIAREEGRGFEPAQVLLERILRERKIQWSPKRGERYREPAPLEDVDLPALPEGWCWTTVDTVGDILLGRRNAPEYRGPNRPYLRVANVQDDRMDLGVVKQMPFDDREFEIYQLRAGDVLVSEGQSAERIGQSAIYRGGIPGLCFQSTLHRFRAFDFGPSSEFAQLVFRAHVHSGMFRKYASITTNIAHLVSRRFKAVPFPLPPIAEQCRIVAEVSRRLSIADEVGRSLSIAIARAGRLRESILKRAFEGKLVPQDPNDEPAAVLLKRIRAERERADTGKTTHGKRRKIP